MPIKVLLADDSDVMRAPIARVLLEDSAVEFVGEAVSFAETLRQTADLKPDVLLIDLHMPDERDYPPEFVKPQILRHTHHVIAISVWNDAKAKALAESFGARVLLDKTKLFYELIPAIKGCRMSIPKEPLRKTSRKASSPAVEASTD